MAAFPPTPGSPTGNGAAGPAILGPDGAPFRAARAVPPVEPARDFALPHAQTFSALIGGAWKTYLHDQWDNALRSSRENALVMRHDAYLMGLLNERKLGTASLKWHLEVDDEDADPVRKGVKEHLTRILRDVPHFPWLLWTFLEAIWFGRYGAQIQWCWKNHEGRRELHVRKHLPVHGDKIGHMLDGTPLILTRVGWSAFDGDAGGSPPPYGGGPAPSEGLVESWERGGRAKEQWAKYVQPYITGTSLNPALKLLGPWRERFVIHQHECLDEDFFEADRGESLHGIGIRDRVYFVNWLKLEYLATVVDYYQRFGLGVNLWGFESGNDASLKAVKRQAADTSNKVNLFVPLSPGSKSGGGQMVGGLERLETPGGGAEVLLKLQQHCEDHLERYIVGQGMSGGRDNDGGLGGTGRAEFAADTKHQLVRWDANNLAETVTGSYADTPGLVDTIHRYSFPETYPGERNPDGFKVRFVFDVDDPRSKERLDAAKTFTGMGGEVVENEVRAVIGFSDPKPGDKTLGGAQAMPGAGLGPDGKPLPGSGPGGRPPQGGNPFGDKPEQDEEGPERQPGQQSGGNGNGRGAGKAGGRFEPPTGRFGRDGAPLHYGATEAGHWITLGARPGADGKKHGGTPVYLEDGRIVKGHPSLTGHRIDALKSPPEDKEEGQGEGKQHAGPAVVPRQQAEVSDKPGSGAPPSDKPAAYDPGTHRQQLNRSRDYDRAVWGKKARQEGLDPRHLHQLTAEIMAHGEAYRKEHEKLLKETRRVSKALGYGDLRTLAANHARGKMDSDSLKGFDDVVHLVAPQFSDILGQDMVQAQDKLYDLLTQGNPEPMSEADAYEQAFDHLHEVKEREAEEKKLADEEAERWKVRDDEEVPFGRDEGPARYGRVEYVRAPKGGATSPVNGNRYEGGEFMPVHGKSESAPGKAAGKKKVKERTTRDRMGGRVTVPEHHIAIDALTANMSRPPGETGLAHLGLTAKQFRDLREIFEMEGGAPYVPWDVVPESTRLTTAPMDPSWDVMAKWRENEREAALARKKEWDAYQEKVMAEERRGVPPPARQAAPPEDQGRADFIAKHTPALESIPAGETRRVAGWNVRKTPEGHFRIETDRGHLEGPAAAVLDRIHREWADQQPDRKRIEAATARARAWPAPTWMEADRQDAEAKAFKALPKGTRVVSLEGDTAGRLGSVTTDEGGARRVKLDGESGFASNHVEPLDEGQSWRTAGHEPEEERRQTQGTLFARDGTPAPYGFDPAEPRDARGRWTATGAAGRLAAAVRSGTVADWRGAHAFDSADLTELAESLGLDPDAADTYSDLLGQVKDRLQAPAPTPAAPTPPAPVPPAPDLADLVHQGGKKLTSAFGNPFPANAWESHKVLVSELYDALKPQLGGMGLDDFKAALLREHQAGRLTLTRQDLTSTLTPAKRAHVGRSALEDDQLHVVDLNPPRRPGQYGRDGPPVPYANPNHDPDTGRFAAGPLTWQYWENLHLPNRREAARAELETRIATARKMARRYRGLYRRAMTLHARTGEDRYRRQAEMFRNSAMREQRKPAFLRDLLDFAEGRSRGLPARHGRPDNPLRYGWSEADHPRGQPANAGQFAPKGLSALSPPAAKAFDAFHKRLKNKGAWAPAYADKAHIAEWRKAGLVEVKGPGAPPLVRLKPAAPPPPPPPPAAPDPDATAKESPPGDARAQATPQATPAPARTPGGLPTREDLASTPVRSFRQLKGGINHSYLATLEDGALAVWKPADGETLEFEGRRIRQAIPGDLYRREAAAADVADLLGLGDLVPPCVARTLAGGKEVGALQTYVPDCKDAADVAGEARWDGTEDLARAAAFDFFIGNTDRHTGNWLVRPDGRLALIDHGLSFPEDHDEGLCHARLLLRAADQKLPLPAEVRAWLGKGKEIDAALARAGLSDAARDLAARRLEQLAAAPTFKELLRTTDLPV